MKEKLLLRKTCSIYASDLHFAAVIFPYVTKEMENGATVKTILERNEKENIEKIIKSSGINSKSKETVKQIDWNESDITKIRGIFKELEENIMTNKKNNIIVLGTNMFIQKVNNAIDLWVKNNMDKIGEKEIELNIINCFSIEENSKLNKIINSHDYILKTSGIEEVLVEEELLKAN